MADPVVTFFGPLDTLLGPYIEFVILGLVLANMGTRLMAYLVHRQQAKDGADAMSRFPVHMASNWVLVIASLYYLTLHHHGGIVMATIVISLFLTDFFEFEARKVEAREGESLELPKAAIAISTIALLYAAFQSLFFIVEPIWNIFV